jgi:hypothetical protein
LDGGGHDEAGGSDADAGPAAVTDHGHARVGHAFHEVAGEVAVAGVPDPLTVSLVEGCPPLVGEVQGVTHRETAFWVVIVAEPERPTGAGAGRAWTPAGQRSYLLAGRGMTPGSGTRPVSCGRCGSLREHEVTQGRAGSAPDFAAVAAVRS